MEHLDAHQRPPNSIRDVYKKYQKLKPKDLNQDMDILDLPDSLNTSAKDKIRVVKEWSGRDLTAAFRAFSGQDGQMYADLPSRIPVYEHADMPGKDSFTLYSIIRNDICQMRLFDMSRSHPFRLALYPTFIVRFNPQLLDLGPGPDGKQASTSSQTCSLQRSKSSYFPVSFTATSPTTHISQTFTRTTICHTQKHPHPSSHTHLSPQPQSPLLSTPQSTSP